MEEEAEEARPPHGSSIANMYDLSVVVVIVDKVESDAKSNAKSNPRGKVWPMPGKMLD